MYSSRIEEDDGGPVAHHKDGAGAIPGRAGHTVLANGRETGGGRPDGDGRRRRALSGDNRNSRQSLASGMPSSFRAYAAPFGMLGVSDRAEWPYPFSGPTAPYFRPAPRPHLWRHVYRAERPLVGD